MTVPLTVSQIFTPMPSGVGPLTAVPLVPPQGTWLSATLLIAGQLQLPTTSWQAGAPERTIFAIESVAFSMSDVNISVIAQGGFLQSAASGSVTYTTLDGSQVTIPVTPDPSNPAQNPTGALGWLDLLGKSNYDQVRLAATFAIGPLAIVNTKPGTIGPFSHATYHAGNTVTGATYANLATLSIPSSIIAGGGGLVTGVTPGLNTTLIQTGAPHGLAPNDVVYIAIPVTSGVSGLANVFAIVVSVAASSFQVAISSSGTYTSGGQCYLCTVATMQADLVGIGSNAAPGSVTTTITQTAGIFASNVVAWSGSNWESNQRFADRCTLSLAALSPNGAGDAYIYVADTAAQFFAAQSTPYVMTNGPVIAGEFANPQTGIVTTVVASTTPASNVLGGAVTPGVSQSKITGVTNANPCIVTYLDDVLLPGQSMTVTITGVLGTLGVNGTFLGTYTSAHHFSIPIDTTSAGAYTGGGSIEGGDLGQVDALLQSKVVPDGITAVTASARALPIDIVATVLVPQVNRATYLLAYGPQLITQLQSYAVGGNKDAAGNPLPVSYNDIVGALEEAGVLAPGAASVASVQALSINGGGIGVGVAFVDQTYQAILGTVSVSVVSR